MTRLDCRLQARCPGCPLGDRSYHEALSSKERGVEAALSPYPELQPRKLPARGAEPAREYRLRAKLVSDGKSLGLFERGSHRVLDVSGCPVLSPPVAEAAEALRRLLPLPIHGADLRETSEGVLVTLLSEDATSRRTLERAASALVGTGAISSVAVSFRRRGDVRLLAGAPEVLSGPSEARHALGLDLPYAYAAHGGFVQAHAAQARYVYSEISAGLQQRLASVREPRVLELFAGNGTLALALSRGGAAVTAVESFAPAIRLAERAAREQSLALRAVAGDATRFVADLAPGAFDAVVVNPPRRGLDVELRRALGRAAPRVIAYVSCNPHTLARDAWHLSRLGLSLSQVEPLDMIPWSDAVEVLSWLLPAPVPPPRVLFEDEQWLAAEKSPYESTQTLEARVQALDDCASARALDAWGDDVSGVCWFAKGAANAGPGERDVLLACRGTQRKQGTITRRGQTQGTRYRKREELGRHSLVVARVSDVTEGPLLRDFASIRHPVIGSDAHGDAETNEFFHHRHGLDRAFLHVEQSELRLDTGELRQARSAPPPDLSRVLSSVRSD